MISMDKKYRTRDGRDVRLLCVDGPEVDLPVVGFISGNFGTSAWRVDGSWSATQGPNDLIEYHEPDIRTIWVNVYSTHVEPFTNLDLAKREMERHAISVAQPVTFEVKK